MNRHERGHHFAAFELYYALGADRSFSEVARRFKTSPNSVRNWSIAFNWQKRISEREKVVSDLVAEKASQDEAQSRADALKITRGAILRFAQTLQPIKNPATGEIIAPATAAIHASDFIGLVKLDQFLRGKPSERSELMIGGPAFDKLIDAIAAVVEREVTDPALRAKLAAGFQEAAASIGNA